MVRTKPEQSSVALRESSRTERRPVASCACPASRAPSIEATRRKSMRARSCSPAREWEILDSSPALLRGERAVTASHAAVSSDRAQTWPPSRLRRPRLLAQHLAARVQLVALGKGSLDLGGVALHVPAGVGHKPRQGLTDARVARLVRLEEVLDERLASSRMLLLHDHLGGRDLHLVVHVVEQ